MSIKEMLAQLRASVAPKGKTAPKAAVVPQPAPQYAAPQPTLQQQQQPATAPAAPRVFGQSIGWANDDAFNTHWRNANFVSNQQAVMNLLQAAFSNDPTRVPAELQGKSPVDLMYQAMVAIGRDAAVFGSETAMRQTMRGLQQDLPLLETTVGQHFTSRTAEQLITGDQRIAGNSNMLAMARHLMEQARSSDPNATPQEIKEYVELTFQGMGVPAFQPKSDTPGNSRGANQYQQQQQDTNLPQEMYERMFGRDIQQPPAPVGAAPNTGIPDVANTEVPVSAFEVPVYQAPAPTGAM